ncbi:unnamed protein product [Pylaiella littoralis]
MEDTAQTKAAAGHALVAGSAGGGDTGSGFGLGVGFALSPELAQKVRECRGVSSALTVPASSLTFLKASPNGTTVKGTAKCSEQTAGASEQQQQHRHPNELQSQVMGDGINATAGAAAATTASVPQTQSASNGNSDGSDGGDREAPEVADESHEVGDVTGDGSGRKGRAQGEGGNGVRRQQKEGQDGVNSEADEEATVAATATTVVDPPDSWEEFDESSVPPAPAATVTAAISPPAPASASASAAGGAGAGAGASSASLKQVKLKTECSSDDGLGGQKEEENNHGPPLQSNQSLPVLLVDLARVCGFRVKGAEEAEAVGGKVRAALHESFAERSEELFETGSAVHADTSTLAEELRRRSEASSTRSSWAIVDYPSYLGRANGNSEGREGGVDTAEAWAAVTASSACRAVEAVRTALVGTNRHLVWKRDMLEQLEAVADSERKAKEDRANTQRQVELEAWRERRREQLERLIEVRPMFERRRAMAEEKLIAAGSDGNGNGNGGAAEGGAGNGASADPVSAAVVQSLDAKLESIDDLIARLEIEEGEEGYGFVPSDEDEDDDSDSYGYDGACDQEGYDHDRHLEYPISAELAAAAAASPSLPAVAAGRRDAAAPGRAEGAAADAAAREKTKKKKKKKKTPGVVEQLKAKKALGSSDAADMSGVGGEEEKNANGKEGDGGDASPPEIGLLDAVAAMILGRYPQDPRATSEQHFQKIVAMHQTMKDAWLAEFGRLPPMSTSS